MSIRNLPYSLMPRANIIKRMELADRLRQAMDRRDKISQYALAKLSGVPQPTINRILKGLSKEPKRSTLTLLADKLGVSREWLISEKGEMYLSKPVNVEKDEWATMSHKRRAIIEKIAQGDLHDSVLDALQGVIDATTRVVHVPERRKAQTLYFGPDRRKKESEK